MSGCAGAWARGRGDGRGARPTGHTEEPGCRPPLASPPPCDPLPPPLLPPAGAILVRFRDSIPNWAAVKAEGHLEGWDEETPTYLWSGIILDFDQRVRVM